VTLFSIGHSCGGGFLVRWLSENKIKADKLVLVAPWLNPDKTEQKLVTNFFDFEIDLTVPERIKEITIITSDNDSPDILKSVEILVGKWLVSNRIIIPGKGHFTHRDMKTDQFPELTAVLHLDA